MNSPKELLNKTRQTTISKKMEQMGESKEDNEERKESSSKKKKSDNSSNEELAKRKKEGEEISTKKMTKKHHHSDVDASMTKISGESSGVFFAFQPGARDSTPRFVFPSVRPSHFTFFVF